MSDSNVIMEPEERDAAHSLANLVAQPVSHGERQGLAG